MSARLLQDTITACLAQVDSESEELQQKALRTLASLTKFSPHNRNVLAQTDGAIPTFLALSMSTTTTTTTTTTTKNLTLSILFNVSLNPNLKQSLAEMETIDHLNSIIVAPSTPEAGKLAASLICSLAMLDKNKARFGVAGTIQALVKALVGPRSPAAHNLLSSLAELVQFHGNCTVAVRAGAVAVLLQVLESTDGEDLAGTCLSILGLLARFEEGINAIRNIDGIVSLLVDVLKRSCMLSKEGSAEVLLCLFEDSEGCVRDALRLPELWSLLADLSVRGSARAREKSGLLMKKMMEANFDSYADGSSMFDQW